MLKFFSKKDDFYTLFNEQVALTVEASRLYHTLVSEVGDQDAIVERIVALEDRGDHQTRSIIEHVNKSFVTPVDREDIHSMAVLMDDILDLIQSAAVRMQLYELQTLPAPIQQMGELLTRCADVLQKGAERLPKLKDVTDLYGQMQSYENEGDNINRTAQAAWYKNCATIQDMIQMMQWKDIISRLEDAVDKYKDMFELLQHVMIKHV
jgi:uncharacterized protein Yka (UPF0111/DUF47 family)